jgi:hypothetical protein
VPTCIPSATFLAFELEVMDDWSKCLQSCLGMNSDVDEFKAMVEL